MYNNIENVYVIFTHLPQSVPEANNINDGKSNRNIGNDNFLNKKTLIGIKNIYNNYTQND